MTTTPPPPPPGTMRSALADIASVFQMSGLISGPLPAEIERVLTRHFLHYFAEGQRSCDAMVLELKQQIATKDATIRDLAEGIRESMRQVRTLKAQFKNEEP